MLRRRFLALPATALAQEAPPIRVDVRLVNVPFSVRDTRGNLVTTLTRDDVEVLEDGAPQKISHFARGSEGMLSLGLIADFSGSQKDFLRDHRRHLSDFLKHLVGGNDQAFLIGFGNSLRLISPFTTDTDRLTDRLVRYQKEDEPEHFPRVGPPENRLGGTAFYDAIYHASEDLLSTADAGRRALIVFSDGEDNASAHHMLDAIEAAQRAGAMIYCLRYSEIKGGRWNSRNKYGRAVMERIAKETGGLDFDAGESRTLHAAFREITDILRAAYDLAYKSSHEDPESGFRKIQLRGKQPGLTFRHKAGYYAKPF